MEKVNFRSDINLVGMLHSPNHKTYTAIIISHGFAANKERQRLVELAKESTRRGIAALRFDFGGSGDSNDREISLRKQTADLSAAISFLKNLGYRKIGLVGESAGALTSILSWDERIFAMVLWAPITTAKIPSLVKKKEIRHSIEKDGYIKFQKDGRVFIVPNHYLQERQSVNQIQILSRIKSPVLVIQGDNVETVSIEESTSDIK